MTRREAIQTAVVLAVACALITALVAVRRDPHTASLSAPPPTTTTVATVDPPNDPELAAFVDEAVAFIEATRGGTFDPVPDVVVLDEGPFLARFNDGLRRDFERQPEAVEQTTALFRALGLISPADRLDEVMRAFGDAGVLGYYDPIDGELVVRRTGDLSLLVRSTIVHELTHAYDDLHFDLDRPDYADRTDEIPWTFQAVAEGSASWVESRWRETLTDAQRARLQAEELSFGDPSALLRFELSFLLLQVSPYQDGEPFVGHLVDGGGTGALDAALVSPPLTSEQVIEPDAFDRGEGPALMKGPRPDGDPIVDGVGGQVLIEALLEGAQAPVEVDWGADEYVVWADEQGRSCVRWVIQAETTDAAARLLGGFRVWARSVGSADVTGLDDVTLEIDRCA